MASGFHALLFMLLLLFSLPAFAQTYAPAGNPAPQPQKNATTQKDYYGADYMQCLQFSRSQANFVHESMREQVMGEMLNKCMYSKGWNNFAPIDEEAPEPDMPSPKQAPAAVATPPRQIPVAPVQQQPQVQAQPQPQGGDFYGPDYMQCLKVARQRSQYVHESMREQAVGELLNECMYARGHSNFAPIDEEGNNPTKDMLLFYSY